MRINSAAILSSFILYLLPGAGENPEIYYRSGVAASAALASFDHKNPDCQLWTNWQKMCSRTGPDGATHCISSSMPVRPSVPFCVARTDQPYEDNDTSASQAERFSHRRFCQRTTKGHGSNDENCSRDLSRPFSGLVLEERRHPWCAKWMPVLAKQKFGAKSSRYGFYCADRRVPDWCAWPEGLGYGRQVGQTSAGEDVIPNLFNPESIAINGVYCRRKASNAR